MTTIGNTLFKIAGILNFGIALLHVGIIFAGAPAYRYFGAGEKLAGLAEAGSPVPALVTFLLVVVFTLFGAYAFSAAGSLRPLPFLLPVSLIVGIIYSCRGLSVLPQIRMLIQTSETISLHHVLFSLVALSIGVMHVLATAANWKRLKSKQPEKENA